MMGPVRKLVPKFLRRRYALKFGIALVILGLSVGLLGYVGTTQIQQEVKGNVNDNYESLAEQKGQSLEAWNNGNELITVSMAGSRTVSTRPANETRPDEREAIRDFFIRRHPDRGTSESLPDYTEEIYWVQANSNLVHATTEGGFQPQGDPVPVTDYTEAPWTNRLGQILQNTNVSEATISKAYEQDDTQVVAYIAPIERNRPPQNTALVYTVNVTGFTEDLATESLPSGSQAMVVDGDGEIVMSETGRETVYLAEYQYQNNVEGVTEGTVSSVGVPEGTLKAALDEGQTASDFTNEDYIAAYAPVGGTDGWVMAVHIPQGEAYGFVTDVAEYGLLATLGGVLLIGLVGAVLGRNTATAIDRLTTKTAQMEEGNLNVDFETKRIDNIGRLYEGFANMRDALSERIQEARDAREEAEEARKDAEEMRDHLQEKAEAYSDVMQQAAEGDLTRRLDPESESQAMTDIAEEFNEMIGEIERTTEQLKNFASEVATSSEEVTASSEEVRSASEQVTESIQEISDGAERQNDSLQSVQQEMDSLSTTTEEIAASSNEVADIAERTAETGRKGRDAAQQAIAGMGEIEDESEQAVQEIAALEREMEQIDELIEFISEIAEQTNMLALNANIEASRSGESGEGFSVVAQEVKELAEETKDAADDIEERLETIQDQTHSTAEEVQRTADRVAEHTDSVRNAAEALEEIAGYAQETNTGVQEISAATEQQAASTQQVVAMVDEAATISEETTAESENVAAAAEEQTTALTEVSRSASDLAEQASRLSEALDRFDTDAEEGFEMPVAEDEPPEDFLPSEDEVEAEADESETLELSEEEQSAEPPVEEIADEAGDDTTEEGTVTGGSAGGAEPSGDESPADTDEPLETEELDLGAPEGEPDDAGPDAEAVPDEGDDEDGEFDMIGFDDVTFEEEGDGGDELADELDLEETDDATDEADEDSEDDEVDAEDDVFTFGE